MASRNVLFFGATGTIGVPILSAVLQHREAFERLVVFTSPGGTAKKQELLAGWKSHGVEVVEGDVQDEGSVLKAFEGIDTIVSALGRVAISLQIPLIRLASAHPSIRRFIPSEFGTDIAHSPSSLNEKPHQAKLKVRAALAEAQDLDYTFLVTGPYPSAQPHMYLSFLDPAKGHSEEMGSWDVVGKKAVLVERGEGRVAFTSVEDVGKFLVRLLTRPSPATKKAALKVYSFIATPTEILQEFERQTDSKWSAKYTSLSDLRKLETKLWEENNNYKAVSTLRRIWAEGGTLYDKWDNEVLGLGKEDLDSLEDAVRKAIETQRELEGSAAVSKRYH